jgi:hypothetical protein
METDASGVGFFCRKLAARRLSTLSAATLYNIDRTVGAGGVTGTILTDGTTGVLDTANVLDWNLVLSDGLDTITLLGPQSDVNSGHIVFTSTASWTATAHQLLFEFSGGSIVFFQLA